MSDDFSPAASAPPPAPEPVAPPAPAAPPSEPPARPRRRLGAVWWGIVLIVLGAVLLVNQFVPGIQLWRYWPLIIVAVGLRGMFGSSSGHWTMKVAAEGLTVVAVGLVFLGQMLGYLAWDVWFSIFRLWPVLLVSLGLDIIGRAARAEWLRVLSSIVVIAALAYGALVMSPTSSWPPVLVPGIGESEPFSMSTDRASDVDEGAAAIKAGASEFSLAAGDVLASAEGRSELELVYEVSDRDGVADVEIGLRGATTGLSGDSELDVTLSDEVVWDLDVSTGVSTFDVDLTDLVVSALDFEAGVSKGTLTLGPADAGRTRDAVSAAIEGGISSLTIRVPEGDDVRATVRAGLSSVDFEGDWERVDDGDRRVYESAGFSDTGAYWDIVIDAGIGSIDIEYY